MIGITRADVELLASSRTTLKYKDLRPETLQAYRNIHAALGALSTVAVDALGGPKEFAAKPTSGYSVEGGVRGYLPKDLWFAAYNRRNVPTFVGMPQVFAIVSPQGVEVGFAATIHPSDFSTTVIKEQVREAAPRIFAALPAPGSDLATALSQNLIQSNNQWFFRRKTRLPANIAEYPDVDSWLHFLRSAEGGKWASGAISRYVTLDQLDYIDLEAAVRETASLFGPWMRYTVPPEGALAIPALPTSGSDDDEAMPLEQREVVRPALESFLARFSAIRASTPFGRHTEIWSLMDQIKAAVEAMPPLKAHPQVKVSWSLGAGVWATVPWTALMDERETTSTQRGLYGVFLFPQDLSGAYLTLNQGVTDVINKYGRAEGRRELARRAQRARVAVPELAGAGFRLDDSIDLQTNAQLGTDYEHSTIAHKFYPVGAVPTDVEVATDLQALLEAYSRVRQVLQPVAQDPATAVPAATPAPRIWLWAPGEGAAYWDELYAQGLMAIGWDELGDLAQYPTLQDIQSALSAVFPRDAQPRNDALACQEFARVIRPGDFIFAKRGRDRIVGHGIVTGEYRYDPTRTILRHTRTVRWVDRDSWAAPFPLPTKTLTNPTLDPEMVDALWASVGTGGATDPPNILPVPQREPYTVEDAMLGLFMPRIVFERMLGVWRQKRNMILQGAPGVGKSFVARRLAYALIGYKDPSRVRTVQFHQAYSYEDFVQGFRPNGNGFVLREGVFLDFCRQALADPEQTYVFIIDEINRGNLSKILGELMLLIEPDKRGPEWAVKLAYAEKASERFYVPPNVLLLGMMNTADRSLAVVDYALRRRFAFVTVEPSFGEESFVAHLTQAKVSDATIARICSRMGALNDAIAADRANLGQGFCIGHSFFSTPPVTELGEGPDNHQPEREAAWYERVIETEVVPLLEEYWFDNPDKAEEWRGKLLG